MIYFIRHGQTDWNALGKAQGRTDIPLNEVGIEQALSLYPEVQNIKIDKYFCSPLTRTRQTFELVVGRPPLESELDSRLIERGFGEYEGQSIIFKDFLKENPEHKAKGVESIAEVQARALSFLNDINTHCPNDNILVVSHGGFGIMLRMILEGMEKARETVERGNNKAHLVVPNGEVFKLDNTKIMQKNSEESERGM